MGHPLMISHFCHFWVGGYILNIGYYLQLRTSDYIPVRIYEAHCQLSLVTISQTAGRSLAFGRNNDAQLTYKLYVISQTAG